MLVEAVHVQMSMIDIWLIAVILQLIESHTHLIPTGKIMLVEAVHVQIMCMIDIWLIGVIGIITSVNKCRQIRGSMLEL